MHYGIYVPNFGDETSVRSLATLARKAEAAGWDGFFIWDNILYSTSKVVQMVDPWIALTAMAMTTERIRIGTTVTPIPRRHPWKLARETASLDHLSGGRLILGVGLGDPPEAEFAQFGEEADIRYGQPGSTMDWIYSRGCGVVSHFALMVRTTISRRRFSIRLRCKFRASRSGSPVSGRTKRHFGGRLAGMV